MFILMQLFRQLYLMIVHKEIINDYNQVFTIFQSFQHTACTGVAYNKIS